MRKISILIAAAFLVLLFVRLIHPAQTSPISQRRTEWIAASLREMEQIKVGMTRRLAQGLYYRRRSVHWSPAQVRLS